MWTMFYVFTNISLKRRKEEGLDKPVTISQPIEDWLGGAWEIIIDEPDLKVIMYPMPQTDYGIEFRVFIRS